MIKQTAILIGKLSVSAILFYFLISKVGGKTILYNMRLLDPGAFFAAVGLYIIASYLSTLRWKLLVPYQSKTSRLFSIYMIGSFFNTYMPGIIGGDAVKAYYLNKEMHATRVASAAQDQEEAPSLVVAIASVFMDRYIGLSALLALAILAFPFGIGYLKRASVQWPVIWIVPAATVFFIACSFLIFKFSVGARLKFLFKTSQYIQFYRSKKNILGRCFIYSIIIQLLTVLSVYVLAKGISLNASFLSLLVFMPIIILVSFLPLSISGIGLREGAFIFLLGSTGIPAEKSMTLSIIWFISVFVAGVWGLIEYLRFKTMFGREEKQKPLKIS
ncbi:MAG: lysylphosphatidylglycerol synthase transmembrane domain-containing protein [Dissulfurispiraceae bacterium]